MEVRRVPFRSGLNGEGGELSPLQDAFWEEHGLQCGYCTPGMLIAAQALLQTTTDPTDEEIREAISGNLCRCPGYQQIIAAVRRAASTLAQQTPRSEEHTSELQPIIHISYAVYCLKKKTIKKDRQRGVYNVKDNTELRKLLRILYAHITV